MTEKKGPEPRVYYIYGNDDYLVEMTVARIKERALTPGFESMNCDVFDGKGVDAAAVIAAASTMPAFSEKRFVLVKGAEAFKKDDEQGFLDYVADASPTTSLVFVSASKKLAKSSRLAKAVEALGGVRACNRLNSSGLRAWIKKEAARQGKEIENPAADKLVRTAGDRLRDIKNELDKIVLFVGDKSGIEARDVEESGIDLKEETVFALSDAIGARDAATALKVLTRLSGEHPLKILGSVARQVRILLKLKTLSRKGTRGPSLAGQVGVPPYFLDKYAAMSRRFTEGELMGALDRLRSMDVGLKSGTVPEGTSVSKLIIDLCEG